MIKNKVEASVALVGCGAKIELIPHQIWVAKNVSERFHPRVLLADEVGLGKTIEAGLIIYQQIMTNKINRVLIVLPESLVHQWFVEMYRKFNLKFSIFQEDFLHESQENPFHQNQLFIVTAKQIAKTPVLEKIQQSEWDLMIVDEAHTLSYSESQKNKEYDNCTLLHFFSSPNKSECKSVK